MSELAAAQHCSAFQFALRRGPGASSLGRGQGEFSAFGSEQLSAFLKRATATTTHFLDHRPSPSRKPQDNVAVALTGAANLPQPVDKLAVEPDPNQAVGTRARCRVGRA